MHYTIIIMESEHKKQERELDVWKLIRYMKELGLQRAFFILLTIAYLRRVKLTEYAEATIGNMLILKENEMDRIKIFESILNQFETKEMLEYCKDMIEKIPSYIFEIPSSTSFKYHNKTQCQPHGQILHILMFGEIMNYILGLEYIQEKYKDSKQRDCLRCTPIFHDAIKCGLTESRYTVHEHPLLASDWIKNTRVEHDIDDKTKQYIARLCESHSGQWVSTKRSKVVLPKPETDDQFLVHLCDYLSSRSNLDMTYNKELLQILDLEKEEIPDINTYIIPFGKYKGKTLPEIKDIDPGYISWAKKNMDKEPVRTLLSQI